MTKWNPILPRDFLWCLSLQAGVVGSSVSGLTLMFITTLVNLYSPNDEQGVIQAVQYSLLFLYLSIMFFGFGMAFLAAFWEISKFLRLAAFMTGIGCVLYLFYVLLSIVPSYGTMISVCPGLRCPDNHWLNQDHWRYILVPKDFNTWGLNDSSNSAKIEHSEKKSDEPSLIFIILTVLYVFIFLSYLAYSALVFLAYAQQLEVDRI